MPTINELLNGSYGETKTASAQPAAKQPVAQDNDVAKIASELGIYNELFPEDADLGKTQKTAEEIKQAQYEEAIGSRSFDYFACRFDQRMSKIAGELMAAADMEAAVGIMGPQSRPPQSIPTNADPMGDKMPLNPVQGTPYSIVAGAEEGAQGQVGHEEQKMAAAVRKHLLLNSLNAQ